MTEKICESDVEEFALVGSAELVAHGRRGQLHQENISDTIFHVAPVFS